MKNRSCRILSIIVAHFLCVQSYGFAAAIPADLAAQSDMLNRQQQRLSEKEAQQAVEERGRQEMVRLREKEGDRSKIVLPEEEVSFYIEKISLTGDYAERFQWIAAYLQKYTGQKIGAEGVNALLEKINAALLERGFATTRVYIKEQDLSSGTLDVCLRAGLIGSIRFEPDTWGTFKNAFSVHRGDILNIRDVEQALEQMKRVPSQDVDIDLEPGEKNGESNLVVRVNRGKNVSLTLTMDDAGMLDTGKLQSGASIEVDNLFSANDIFSASFGRDAAGHDQLRGTKSHSLYYTRPFGKQTLTISQADYEYHQTVETAVLPFLSSGKITNTELRLSHLMRRDQTRRSGLEFNLSQKKRHSYINGTEIGVQRQKTSAAQLGITHRQYLGQNVLDAALYYQHGVPWFGAQPGPTDDMEEQPSTRYGMWIMDLSYHIPFQLGTAAASYDVSFRGQNTKDRIYGSEFFSIGGRYSVRGFDGEQTLSAENGFVVRNEISVPLNEKNRFYAALDYGRVQGESARYLTGSELVGGAVGFRGNWENVRYDVFVGWPVKKPDGFKTAKQTFGFQIMHQI